MGFKFKLMIFKSMNNFSSLFDRINPSPIVSGMSFFSKNLNATVDKSFLSNDRMEFIGI